MRLFFLHTFLFLSLILNAQNDLQGTWKGVLIQDSNGSASETSIELKLQSKGNKILGYSKTSIGDLYQIRRVEGTCHSDLLLLLTDFEILEDETNIGMEWCKGTYQLVVKRLKTSIVLEGEWQGTTSFNNCAPGKLKLEKIVPRA